MGIASDGSPLFLHHITDLGSPRRDPNPSIVALVRFQRSTTVVAITSEDCFRDVPNKDEDTIKVPIFSKLASATTASAFKRAETAEKEPHPREPGDPAGATLPDLLPCEQLPQLLRRAWPCLCRPPQGLGAHLQGWIGYIRK
jgi:hypothetical protein